MNEFIDETENIYEKWTVLRKYESVTSSAAWLCRCKCGYERPILGVDLRRNKLPLCTNCCHVCGKTRDHTEFKGNKRICMDCDKQRIREWKDKTGYYKEKIVPWLKKNPEAVARYRKAERIRIQSSHEFFLSALYRDKFRKLKRLFISLDERTQQKAKSPARCQITITEKDVLALWDKQHGLCAISGMPMAHEFKNLRSASVDRIDNDLGYVPGNIQLVCQWVNYAKNRYSNAEIGKVLAEYKAI